MVAVSLMVGRLVSIVKHHEPEFKLFPLVKRLRIALFVLGNDRKREERKNREGGGEDANGV